MTTKAEFNQIMAILNNEYPNFLPSDSANEKLKKNTWYELFRNYDFEVLKKAVQKMILTFEYGTPKPAHLNAILNPPMKEQ
ncbi:MAG: replicative helicase loader/inhibitor, partial [Coprobacillaceae bacterium]